MSVFDEIFRRDDVRGKYPDKVNETNAFLIGRGLAELFLRKEGWLAQSRRFVIGHDARLSCPSLLRAIAAGIESRGEGIQACSVGLSSTEVIYYLAAGLPDRYAAGIMITASHNPKDENGFKIVRGVPLSSGRVNAVTLSTEDLGLLKEIVAAEPEPDAEALPGREPELQPAPLSEYVERVIAASGIERTLRELPADQAPFKVVVEGGNGVGAHFFREVAESLKGRGLAPNMAFVYSRSEPDGNFPDFLPNPLKPAYMGALQELVEQEDAHLGICFDGDGDRAGFVDDTGQTVTPSQICALIANKILGDAAESGAAQKPEIMYNLSCSRVILDAIREHGGEPFMSPVGHGRIKAFLFEDEHAHCLFAGEHSGHYFFPDFYCADSGVTAALVILGMAVKEKLSGELSEWRQQYFMSVETNFRFSDTSGQQAATQRVLSKFAGPPDGQGQGTRLRWYGPPGFAPEDEAAAEQKQLKIEDKIVRIELEEPTYDWWIVVRPSGNEPLLRLVVEAIPKEDCAQSGQRLMEEKLNELIDLIGRECLEEK